uniref:Tick transposon n=1 Tax=Rhipicephalus appendiculatus TaxID=34631 RepID=A0A131YLQ8_RHIAP
MSQFRNYRDKNSKRSTGAARQCTTAHRDMFTHCDAGVLYEVPFECGKRYIGQTGRCVNDRLREHRYNVGRAQRDPSGSYGTLASHSVSCCEPDFNRTRILARGVHDTQYRRWVERDAIEDCGLRCVNNYKTSSGTSTTYADEDESFISSFGMLTLGNCGTRCISYF